ncbi:ProQ/FINO family protein [Aliiruegeria lutimaris]|uniref:ProQ/FINO family protein n=1 Tax=Aliiruegeria lutimaris TaxID=571298 RepID=A0A1G8KJ78_9RHOB|nr:ProQ/FINO family protein [Aliiruegeria lutimaris]SDI43478.1 ProQ/FINO family protein [Aliiruegeria lutimaris]
MNDQTTRRRPILTLKLPSTTTEARLQEVAQQAARQKRLGAWKASRDDIMADLAARFPAAFGKRSKILPLARGIHRALAEACPDLDLWTIKQACQRRTTWAPYLEALAADGSTRYLLDGSPAPGDRGTVTDDERQHAQRLLKRRVKK